MNIKKHLSAVLASGAILCAASHANAVLFYSQDGNSNGLYTLNTTTGAPTLVGAGISGVTSITVGLAPSASSTQLWGSRWQVLLDINADGSGATEIGGPGMEGLAFNPNSGILYYSFNGDFGTVNTGTGDVSTLAAPGGDVEGLAYGGGNTIFGLAAGGILRSYDIGTNMWSVIGNTGVDFDQIGLAYDPLQDVLFAIGDQDPFLYSIDPANAAATQIGDTGFGDDSGGGLAFITQQVRLPEPGTLALFGLGLAGLGFAMRRRMAS